MIVKIAFFRHSLLNRGGDKMVLSYAGRLVETGHQVLIYTSLVDTVFEIPPGVEIHRTACPGKFGTVLSAVFQRIDADVVIGDIIAMAFLLSLRNRRKVVHFAQDYNENVYSSVLLKLLIRFLYAVTLSLFRVPTIAVSQPLSDELNGRFNAKARKIQNGIDLRVFYPESSHALKEGKQGRKAILFFSRRDRRKGFDLALETIRNISTQTEIPIELWTVGEPLNKGDVPCPCNDYGYVCEQELRRIMSSADVFLYPSRCEGMPVMVLEAFACGCPVVTTEAIPYAVDDENSLVARIEDVDGLVARVKRVLTNEAVSRKLADTAREFVLQYSLDSAAEEFEKMLRAIREK